MGIDIRTSRADYPDRNVYYKGKYVEKGKLVMDAVAQGVFYSTDKEPLSVNAVSQGSNKWMQYSIKLETRDFVNDLIADDYVIYSGYLWRVTGVIAADDNKNKRHSSRPAFVTLISLSR